MCLRRHAMQVLVPLAYRPAIKAALLDAKLLLVMADVLGEPWILLAGLCCCRRAMVSRGKGSCSAHSAMLLLCGCSAPD